MDQENLLARLGTNWIDNSAGDFNSSDFEFSQYFQSKKIKIGEKNLFLWRIKKKTLEEVDAIFFNLPGYKKAISNIAQLVIGKGILAENEKTEAVENQLKEFLATFPGGQLYFLWETCRLVLTKGNCLVSLLDFSEDDKNPDYNFVNINPENFGVLNPSNKPIGRYIANKFVYIYGGDVTKIDESNLLDSNSTIHLKSTLSGILGVPPTIINATFSNAVLKDILSWLQTKSRGGLKKNMVNFSTTDSNGGTNYLSTTSKDPETVKATIQIKKDLEKSLVDSKTNTVIVGSDFKIGELSPAENSQDFKTFINEVYPLYTANLAGVAPYSLLPPKSVNRSTTEEQYKEMIQNTIQPLNNYLSEKIQKLYEIWCEKSGKDVMLKLTLDNPKPELSIQKSVADILKAVELGIIDIDEARAELGLNPASKEQKTKWENRKTETNKKEISEF